MLQVPFRLRVSRSMAAHEAALTQVLGRIDLARLAATALPPDADADLYVYVIGAGEANGLCEELQARRADGVQAAVLVAAADLDSDAILRLLCAGAQDFIALPLSEAELVARVKRLLGPLSPPAAGRGLPPRLRATDFIGAAPAFLRQINLLPTLAACDAGVLITGETGTGKEVCAQAVHYLSSRASRPWVAINCAAIPAELMESELFGHVKGAFTNALAARQGLVREAEGGTLFLDDVDCLPLPAQAKLLRFLQEREYRQVGANTVQRADVRVIAATNRPLADLVAQGQFRQDLYYRLNVLTLQLPPLRERRGDIPALALHFARHFGQQFRRGTMGLSPPALRRLLSYTWPGNVRELRHVIERAVVLAPSTILGDADIEIFGQPVVDADSFRAAKARVVSQFEQDFIEHLLLAHAGNVTHAARAAGKNRRAFFELMRKHRIEAARFKQA